MAEHEGPDYEGNTYRAIGRYVVRFAVLVDTMRNLLARQLMGDGAINAVPYLLMGEMTAQPIANSFFGACRLEAELSDADQKVERALNNQVNDQIKFRNDLAHGDWSLDAWRFARTPPGVSELFRLRPARKAGFVDAMHISAEALETRCVALDLLTVRLIEYGSICFGLDDYKGLHVSDVLTASNKLVRRDGEKASQIAGPEVPLA